MRVAHPFLTIHMTMDMITVNRPIQLALEAQAA
jgi:hypothetical protein